MEMVRIALARLERIKVLLETWQQKKAIPNIERNIVLNQLANLYDELLEFTFVEDKTLNRKVKEDVELQEAKMTDVIPETVEITVTENNESQATIVQTPPTLTIEDNFTDDKHQRNAEYLEKEQSETVRLGDKYVGLHKYLFENFENQDEAGVARMSAVDDINRAIGINDRFLFIKELFNGDKDLFNKTISKLNDCNSIDDALMYIHENFKWNSEDAAVKQLVLLLYRRFK